jgi:hypothetical protein
VIVLRKFVIHPLLAIGYWLLAIGYGLWAIGYGLCSSEPGTVIHVDRDEKQDAFDQVEGHIGASESQD